MERNNGETVEVLPGTFIMPEVVWADSFRLEFLGEKGGQAYFRAYGSWIENHQQSMNPFVKCDMSDLVLAVKEYAEAGALALLRDACKRTTTPAEFAA